MSTRDATYQTSSQLMNPTRARTAQEMGLRQKTKHEAPPADEALIRAIAAAVTHALATQQAPAAAP
ncbi:hypothetical protein PF005_g7687 [Phytophthora fragariae]|uniref:Uncharacterized protein n=1 Tax=Phytophthora fragariae TaxID=53985 RepID=A0A6A4DQV7_9STRA|nr:hypothetical protein PF003_g36386 [Phytophthora fragariae]KAE8941670.1 hypothetical protein PF009_g8545 [Phytophthora fragariae]KAE9005115.1 hypothetical protein PF011_g12178 [Phytophthora fragariae]KAE9108883.1 hypothetical protein PF007_g12475 [Phytophthora fragariae]KAE9139961.1 hypothetical protein PF006_g13637 [Phytophthora fragariae]